MGSSLTRTSGGSSEGRKSGRRVSSALLEAVVGEVLSMLGRRGGDEDASRLKSTDSSRAGVCVRRRLGGGGVGSGWRLTGTARGTYSLFYGPKSLAWWEAGEGRGNRGTLRRTTCRVSVLRKKKANW